METISGTYLVVLIVTGMALGFVLYASIRYVLPRRLRSNHEQQRRLIIEKAQARRSHLLHEASKRADERVISMYEELQESIEEETLTLQSIDTDLSIQEKFFETENERVQKVELVFQAQQNRVDELKTLTGTLQDELARFRVSMQEELSKHAEVDALGLKHQLTDNFVNERNLDSQKRIKELVDDLESHSKKGAERFLSRILSRYQPTFVWPKATNHVEITNQRLFDQLQANPQLLTDLQQLTEGVEISLSPQSAEGSQPIVRLAGGYGIFKEAAKLTLEELLPKGPNSWGRCERTYAKFRQNLEIQALKLGRQALLELKLTGIHEEIQKMIGALNWRTSYRQNQYHHSVEVARLAGLIAFELGVDPDVAKRCGLLHDIGKGIDYRIEGSHAVISGDYADRFGEKRLICDTVMSHHNDLVLDTPMSYVLKSADTLSGARPGARINLEEGYQDRLAAMEEAIKSFHGIQKVAIMNGGREVHIGVNHKRIKEEELKDFCAAIARKLEQEVAFPGQIKVLVTRRFEATAVA